MTIINRIVIFFRPFFAQMKKIRLSIIFLLQYEYIRGPGSDLTFVSPRGGISLNWHTQGEVTGYVSYHVNE